ncbi:MAG: DUF6084 family protein [Actinomycetes bacterium]
MTELGFDVVDMQAEQHAAAPTLLARLRITESTGERVHAIALRAQVRIDPQRRGYTDTDKASLVDLFGEPERWGQTLKPFLWMHCTAMVQGFQGSTEVDLQLPCTYDVEVVGSKYLHGVSGGEVPLSFLFNGTIITRGDTGFAVTQVPWHSEAGYRMPVSVWRDLMDHYFPGSGWLRLDRETLDALARYKSRRALPTWEEAFAMLLKEAGEASS